MYSALKRRLHDMGLLPRLMAGAIVVLVILFGGGVLFISQMTSSLRDSIQEERLFFAETVAEDLDAALRHSVTELQGLAERYRQAVAKGVPEEMQGTQDLLAGESDMFTRGILIVGPEGEVIATDRRHPGPTELDLSGYLLSSSYRGFRTSEVLTQGFRLPGDANPTVAIAVPVGLGGELAVGLADAMNSYPARVVARAARLDETGHADIVGEDGIAVFSTEAGHVLVESYHQSLYRDLSLDRVPVILELPLEAGSLPSGEDHLMAVIPLETLPWSIAVGTTVSAAYAPVQQLWYGGFGLLALVTGVALLATFIVSRRLVRPVTALSVAARKVAEGDRTVTVGIPWGGEIGELARSLETMRESLQAWASELEDRVRRRTAELEEGHAELRMLNERLQRKEEQVRAILGKVLGAQEDERKRVSRELHDGIGQALSALTMGLERLEEASHEQWDGLGEHVRDLRRLGADTLDDLRRMTIALRPAALDDLGLLPAIRRYAELYLGGAGLDFELAEEGLTCRLDPALETVVYRVVQEAINNAARHSAATRVRIALVSTDGAIAAVVEDNGQGFDPALVGTKPGVGLQGMQERASLAGGKLTVESEPGRGAKVRLEIPLEEVDVASRDG